jgi:hypothetical protein
MNHNIFTPHTCRQQRDQQLRQMPLAPMEYAGVLIFQWKMVGALIIGACVIVAALALMAVL